jgi:aerobic carbon-monoxide dehydrogenase large subunit
MAADREIPHRGFGASLARKEDDRHLRGQGQFVADIALRDMQEVVFVHSPHAHALVRSITIPDAARGSVFTAAELPRIKPIRVVTEAPGARSPPRPPLAIGKVRYVGESVAACVARTREVVKWTGRSRGESYAH